MLYVLAVRAAFLGEVQTPWPRVLCVAQTDTCLGAPEAAWLSSQRKHLGAQMHHSLLCQLCVPWKLGR